METLLFFAGFVAFMALVFSFVNFCQKYYADKEDHAKETTEDKNLIFYEHPTDTKQFMVYDENNDSLFSFCIDKEVKRKILLVCKKVGSENIWAFMPKYRLYTKNRAEMIKTFNEIKG